MSGFGLGFGFAYVRSILSRVAATEIFTANTGVFGTGKYLTTPDNEAFEFGDGDFTCASWANFAATSTLSTIFHRWYGGIANANSWYMNYSTVNSGEMHFSVSYDGHETGSTIFRFPWVPTLNTDYHLAVERVGADLNFLVDGVQVGASQNIGTNVIYNSPRQLAIGVFISVTTPVGGFDGELFGMGIYKKSGITTELYNEGTVPCYGILEQATKDACSIYVPDYNFTGFVGQELDDQSSFAHVITETGTIGFTGTAQILCEEYVPSVNDMLMTIDTTQVGSASDTFIFPLTSMGGLPSIQIAWGDGSSSVITAVGQAELTHVYAVGGVKNLTVIGSVGYEWAFNNAGDKLKLKNINQWGSLTLITNQFYGCTNLLPITATDSPLLIGSLVYAFRSTTLMTSVYGIENWVMTGITTGGGMLLSGRIQIEKPIWKLDVCTSLAQLFRYNQNINPDLSECTFPLVTIASNFIDSAAFTPANLDKMYIAMANQPLQSGTAWGFGSTQYTSASATERQYLIDTYGLILTDGGLQP